MSDRNHQLVLIVGKPFGFVAGGTVSVSVVVNDAEYNRLVGLESNMIALGYQGIPWAEYAFKYATNLTDPVVWIPVYTNMAGTNGGLNFTNSTTEAEGYFRVHLTP